MTIDEVIYYEKRCSERSDAFVGYTTKEHKQLAEWLEELKAIRQWKADVMESFCKYDVNSFEELVVNVRAKVIDEFYEEILNFEDYIEPIDTSEFGAVLLYSGKDITNMIVKIKEQLKEGDSNGT